MCWWLPCAPQEPRRRSKADLNQPNLEAVKAGASNLIRHIDNLKNGFGLPVVVAINAFPTDTAEEQAYVEQVCAEQGVPCVLSEVFAKGGEGGKALAERCLRFWRIVPSSTPTRWRCP